VTVDVDELDELVDEDVLDVVVVVDVLEDVDDVVEVLDEVVDVDVVVVVDELVLDVVVEDELVHVKFVALTNNESNSDMVSCIQLR